MSRRKIEYWVIPPEANGEFVACMEDVIEVYSRPYDKSVPVVVMDEQPVQLLKETRKPIEATLNHPKRVDYEYERAGTAQLFLFAEPKIGWRSAKVRKQKTKIDWAKEIKVLIDSRYQEAEKVILVCDNLNTHTKGAFYEAFAPDVARSLAQKIEFHHTPKHGSWLNIAECELSSLTRQCLKDRRIESIESLQEETKTWANSTNEKQRAVDWQLTIDGARMKLKSLYPIILS